MATLLAFDCRWTKAVHKLFADRRDFVGLTLQDEYLMTVGVVKSGIGFRRPVDTPVFLYRVMEPWGFTPHPYHWRRFQVRYNIGYPGVVRWQHFCAHRYGVCDHQGNFTPEQALKPNLK